MSGRRAPIVSVQDALKPTYNNLWKSLAVVPAEDAPQLGLTSNAIKNLVATKWNELYPPQQQPKTGRMLTDPLQFIQRWLRLDTTTSDDLETVIQTLGLDGDNLRKLLSKQEGMAKFAPVDQQFGNIVPAIIVEPPEANSMSALAKKIRPPDGSRSATKRYVARQVNKTLKRCVKLGLITTKDEWNKYEVELNHVAKVHGKISSMDLPNVLKCALPAFVLTLKLAKKKGWSYEETIDQMDRKKIILKRVKKTAPESLPPMRLFQTPPTSPAAKSLSPEFLTAPDGANESVTDD